MSQWSSFLKTTHLTGPSTKGFWSLSMENGFHLYFCVEGLLAIPASFKDSLVLAAMAGCPEIANVLLRTNPEDLERIDIDDSGEDSWLRFPRLEIRRITCRKNKFGFGRHKIMIETKDGKAVTFGFFIRSDFAPCCQVLQRFYGDLVCDG